MRYKDKTPSYTACFLDRFEQKKKPKLQIGSQKKPKRFRATINTKISLDSWGILFDFQYEPVSAVFMVIF